TPSPPLGSCQAPAQRLRVDGCAYLGVVVEIDIDVADAAAGSNGCIDQLGILRLAALAPASDARGPAVERGVAITAGVQLLRAVQPAAEETRGDILGIGPID